MNAFQRYRLAWRGLKLWSVLALLSPILLLVILVLVALLF